MALVVSIKFIVLVTATQLMLRAELVELFRHQPTAHLGHREAQGLELEMLEE